MKVLFFTNIPSPYRVDFFNELGKQCDLTVLYERCDADDRDKSWMKADGDMHYKAVFLKGKKVGADTALCFDVLQYWKDPQYDIRIVGDYATPTGMLSILYMRLMGIPYGVELDGAYLKPEKAAVTWLKKVLLSKCSFAFSSGETTDTYLKNYGVSEDRIFFYPFTSLKKEDLRSELTTDEERNAQKRALEIEEKHVVLSVGRFSYMGGYGKGYDVLIRAAQILPESVGWYIVGGEPTEEFIEMVNGAELENVHFVPFMDKHALRKYYTAADIFVLMTISDVWGLVINEAMANALPVITTDKCVAGLELVEDGKNGHIVHVGDETALANRIAHILKEEQTEAMGKHSLEVIREYTVEKMVTWHMDGFSKIRNE